jgi:hypothetical protein
MSSGVNLPFSDRALQPGEADLLGRGAFVRNLVTILCNAPKGDSVVFALYGKWGEGKTSTLALLEAEFAARSGNDEPTPVVIRFNPWVFSGRERLFAAFFEDIGNAIGASGVPGAEEKAKKWKRLGAYSNLLGQGLNHVDTVLNVFGASVPGWKLLGKFLGSVGEVADQAAAAEDAAPDQSLYKIRSELEVSLSEMTRPLLVVLDDLDRLPPNELVEIFQLLKASVDLPNVHYLLLCDRGNIERNLKKQGLQPDYLEKIVQFGVSIPAVPDARLRSLLISQLKILFGDVVPRDDRMDEDFWEQLEAGSLTATFSSLRDVKRYLGELRLALPVFARNGFFELNPDHFLKLQALRLFCPQVVDLIRSRRDLFLQKGSGLLFSSESEKARSEKRRDLVENEIPAFLSAHKLSTFEKLCRELLQSHGVDMSGKSLAAENRFLSSRLWFDAYFTLEVPQNVVRIEDIGKLRLKASESQEALSEFVSQLIAKVGDVAFVRCLEIHFREDIRELGLGFLIAMLSADSARPEHDEDSDAPWDPIYDYFAHWVRLIQETQRRQRVLELLESSRNHHWFSRLLSDLERGVSYTRETTTNLIPFADSLGRANAKIIEENATREKLELVPSLEYDLFVWEKWGSKGRLKNWIRENTRTDGGLRAFFLAMGQYVMANVGADLEHECFWINHQRLSCVPNFDDGIRRAKRMLANPTCERERLLWKSVVESLSYAREFRRGSRFFRLKFPEFLRARFHPQSPMQITDDRMAIVTAENSNGITATNSENRRLTENLAAYLAEHGIHASPMPVGAPDGSHVEESFLIPVDNDRAVEIGRQFQQIAIFMIFSKERVEIVSCEGKGRHQIGNLKDIVVWPPVRPGGGED